MTFLRRLAPASLLLLLAACTLTQPKTEITPPKVPVKPRIALALGGGAAKGFAHVGVIKMLEANGIVPDIITGTSAGSVVGSLYASGLNGMQLQAKAMQLDESELTDWTLSTKGFLKGEKLEAYINTQLATGPSKNCRAAWALSPPSWTPARKWCSAWAIPARPCAPRPASPMSSCRW